MAKSFGILGKGDTVETKWGLGKVVRYYESWNEWGPCVAEKRVVQVRLLSNKPGDDNVSYCYFPEIKIIESCPERLKKEKAHRYKKYLELKKEFENG